MELRALWHVLVRWRWVIAIVTLAAVVASGILAVVAPPGYKAQTILTFAAPVPPANVSLPGLDEQNRFLYAEQAVDDFTKIIPTRDFSEAVAKRLTFPMDPKQIEKVWTIKKQAHHLLSIEAAAPTDQKAVELAKAAGDEIQQNGARYYGFLGSGDLKVATIQSGVSEGVSGRLLDYLFVIARIVVGVIVGIGLAFLLNYLDDRINGPDDAESLGFRVIGAIPQVKSARPIDKGSPVRITAVGT